MADNKQYITQNQDNGAVMISEEVIATIVTNAISDVDGVVSIGNAKTNLERKLLNKGMKITVTEANEVTIECNIVVTYGSSVITVAKAAQEAAASAVEAMTGIKPVAVNVNVSGIVRQ
ncbi:MAG: Asp23/Gls24 family envelope stress response protein [Oscillospiraceae bacterium]|nr:Asp23/Gls24 family envelope stress response protein [Oscillospiraceae bacterium]